MKLPSSLGQVLLRVVIPCLMVACTVQIVLQVRKYARGQKTITRSSQTLTELDLPGISFCLGFKKEKVLKLPWMLVGEGNTGVGEDDTFPSTAEAAEALWDDITFDLEDIRVTLYLIIDSEATLLAENLNKLIGVTGEDDDGNRTLLEVQEHNTLSGKCYTLRMNMPFKVGNMLSIYFYNLDVLSRPRLTLFYHHPDDSIGLNENYWTMPASNNEINVNEVSEILLSKHLVKWRTDTSEENFVKCRSATIDEVVRQLGETSSSFCRFPSFESILKHSSLDVKASFPACAGVGNYEHSLARHIYGTVLNPMLEVQSICGLPSEQSFYGGTINPQVKVVRERLTPIYVPLLRHHGGDHGGRVRPPGLPRHAGCCWRLRRDDARVVRQGSRHTRGKTH